MSADHPRQILKKVLTVVHFGFGLAAIIAIQYFASPETRYLFLGLVIGYILSALLLLLLYRKSPIEELRQYLYFVCLLPGLYVVVWGVLGLLMMH